MINPSESLTGSRANNMGMAIPMTDPRRYLTRQILFVLLVAILVWALYVSGPLYDAFAAIENMGSVSQGILAGGLKVASTTTLYGLLVYIISRILHLIS